MEEQTERRMYYVMVKRLYNRRVVLFRYEDDGSYALKLTKCLSKQDSTAYIEERKAAGLPSDLVRGRLLVTNMELSAEAVQAVSQLYQAHEKYAEERQQLKEKREQIALARESASTHSDADTSQ